MRWDNWTFAGADDLAVAARHSLEGGLTRRVRRDDSEPALAWLDRLGQARSDWLPTIGVVLCHLGLDDELTATATADFFATARVAPALVGFAQALLRAGADPYCAVNQVHVGGWGPTPLSEIAAPLEDIAQSLRRPGWAFFDRPPVRAANVSTRERRHEAVRASVAVGRQRTISGFDPCTLGWLRHLAFFAPDLRPEVAWHLGELARGDDPRGWFCLAEYLAIARDMHWLTDLLTDLRATPASWSGLRFGMDEPEGWPEGGQQHRLVALGLGEHPTLGALLAHAGARAEMEIATAPRNAWH